MTHKRNTAGLAQAAQKRREDTLKRVEFAIKQLVKEKKQVNFNSISKLAQVGKPWLYKEDFIRKQIEVLRKKLRLTESATQNFTNLASDKSKDNIVKMLKERIAKLETENKKLREQIEVLYGELYGKREASPS